MTDLQVSLIVIGGTIVAGVITYNKWQEYKAKKSVERAFASDHDDVLMTPDGVDAPAPTGRHEPSFSEKYPDIADAVGLDEQPVAAPEQPAVDAPMPAQAPQKELP